MPLPKPQGLYNPEFEHDACGLGFVATLDRRPSNAIVRHALEILANLTHRGAAGCDPCTGDGAGILLQIPHALYAQDRANAGISLPAPGDYAVAMCFLAPDPARRRRQEAIFESAVEHYGQRVLGWRDVPLDTRAIGPTARDSMPAIRQLFIGRAIEASLHGSGHFAGVRDAFERTLFMIRKRAGRTASVQLGGDDFYVCSCSSKTVVYKGLLLAEQLAEFYPELSDPRTVTRLALVHSRFSTNTFPSWERAHPFRMIAHNGEINTLSGNRVWMSARESRLKSPLFGKSIEDFTPIIRPGGSDSASLDNVVDFLVASGRSLPHVMMMLLPEASTDSPEMTPEKRAFYEYHDCLIEPWDGPAALTFTDGELVGAMLDRNGLRPAKYVVTSDGLVVLASEFGVLDIEPSRIVQKGRVKPGKMLLIDTVQGRIIPDAEIKHRVATQQPYRAWLDENKIDLAQIPAVPSPYDLDTTEIARLQQVFGYTAEDCKLILAPMAVGGEEPVGSMGADIPIAVLSERPQLLFRYFKQRFAQVTNPPIDPIREEVVMSMTACVGGEGNLLDETPRQCRMLQLPHPILSKDDLARLRRNTFNDFRVCTIAMRFPLPRPGSGRTATEELRDALEAMCAQAQAAVDEGASILILSDRDVGPEWVPIPSLLATAALHHSLILSGRRLACGIIVESAEPREVAHIALLVGYGAGAINPYLALATVAAEADHGQMPKAVERQKAVTNTIKAMRKGLLKTMSKMGISSVACYQGAQIFEAIGIDQVVIDQYFTGTSSRIRGIGLTEMAEEALGRHARAYGRVPHETLDVGGHIHFRVQGEKHLWSPQSVAALQKAVRLDDAASYDEYARLINDQSNGYLTLRGMWDLVPAGPALPLDEVEPATELVKRFATGAMSFGSISKEAHENLAIAMNRIGGRSNTGEGGEDPERLHDERRSSIKQVASGRFGVTTEYLANADELQIKMAQGAKPGEGGQLPGHKVDAVIARVRHSTPGVTLISPPPHHDIYSIEDLAQLVLDLKTVNPAARISVKLVSEAGVGTIAAGVAKAHADAILISGHDGGTGASPLTSIHHAGTPWELGLAEAQQVLVLNGLRSRVRLQVDGQLKTGRDVIFGALLGAEEFGFATAPLVASGCILMRKCHLNTCPVGVATQDPELRKRFTGQPEHVIRYFFYVAEEVRKLLAELGFRKLDEAVGQTQCIAPRRFDNQEGVAFLQARRAAGASTNFRRLDFSELLYRCKTAGETPQRCMEAQDHDLRAAKDHQLIAQAHDALAGRGTVHIAAKIRNSDRAFGAMISGEIARRHGGKGLPAESIVVSASGSAGQSFGAFAAHGLTLALEGDANDYVGKGLSGGTIAIFPPKTATFRPEENAIVGNTVLYGATEGKAFFGGRAGERFCVRNSGVTAVVEGVGDHGCEYMTGGTVVILGRTGRNFGAGMSGGLAYVLDVDKRFAARCNLETIELVPLTDKDGLVVRELLREHVERTGSPQAKVILADWPTHAPRFVKVFPSEYRRILSDAAAPETAGIPIEEPVLPLPMPGGV